MLFFRKKQSERLRPTQPVKSVRSTSFSSPVIESLHTFQLGSLEPAGPMQLGKTKLTSEERLRRFHQNVCLYCGGSGYSVISCPLKGKAQQEQVEISAEPLLVIFGVS